MPLKYKPMPERVRLVYSNSPQAALPEFKDKVFAVIGPLENFDDKLALQEALKMLVRGWNIKPDSE